MTRGTYAPSAGAGRGRLPLCGVLSYASIGAVNSPAELWSDTPRVHGVTIRTAQ